MDENNDTLINYDRFRRPVTFILLVTVIVPSIVCSLLILSFFFTHWNMMITKALQHHAVFLLTIISFLYTCFDLPFSINYLRVGFHHYRSVPFCLWWYWFDYSLLGISLWVTATASVQRHILIFHSHWLNAKKNRILLHYVPLIISFSFSPLVLIGLMFILSCQMWTDMSEGWCAYPCYIDQTMWYHIDWLCNTITPMLIIVLSNITLFIRVVWAMKRIHQRRSNTAQQQKKLAIQMFAYTSIYVIAFVPTAIVATIYTLVNPNLYSNNPKLYNIYHLIYFVCPLQSFICILALPEVKNFIRTKMKRPSPTPVTVPAITGRSYHQ